MLASTVRSISVAVGLPVDANTIVGVSAVVGIPAVKGFPSAADVCDAPIVSAAVHQTVADVLFVSSAVVAGIPAERCCFHSV